ncbi:proline iminopeptidase-family hydrolase [Roseisolibacter sp. H3M3-2]|uniref:proline iminopeptidase-family hydrolase n=1 Tax=Roseisolibacter sp. H3M3-2 TaxID=3031323 RepID=UPI0023DCDA08|nr:proline iminopeptidase-family hydrolase [Roseisolibacter sp. H3M3-2]MDF1505756.1 proline iminopeptidase-family hydrolase [Roseisolibacter sp. H3M3-2]
MRAIGRFLLLVSVVGACRAAPRPLTPGDGMLQVPGGRIWYRVVGSGPGTPLLLIHGGPGGRACRLYELRALADERPVIFYDQLGTGRSERPADTTYWNVAHFVEEVAAIRRQLGLREVHLLGHSWGGTVAAEYLLTRGSEGVRSVTLAGPLLSTPAWLADARALVAQLGEPERRAIAEAEASGRYDTRAFAAANDSFSVRFNRRRAPSPAADADCAGSSGNDRMYRAMWGPSEFSATGTLRDYDRTARLGELRLPVLLMAGEFDEARPATMEAFRARIPGARVAIIPGAAHGMMNDEPAATAAAVRGFLREAEREKAR